jgi:hypothetical protein
MLVPLGITRLVGIGPKYPGIVANWTGGVTTTILIDGFRSVDLYACNAREIMPPIN